MLRFSLVCMVSVSLFLGSLSPAHAQEREVILGLDEDLWLTSTSTTSTALTIGGGVLTATLIRNSSSEIEIYIQTNAVAIQHDLFMGAGESSDDLARLFHVAEEHRGIFSDLLFSHREELAPLAAPGRVNSATAVQFIEVIVENMLRDEELAEYALQMVQG